MEQNGNHFTNYSNRQISSNILYNNLSFQRMEDKNLFEDKEHSITTNYQSKAIISQFRDYSFLNNLIDPYIQNPLNNNNILISNKYYYSNNNNNIINDINIFNNNIINNNMNNTINNNTNNICNNMLINNNNAHNFLLNNNYNYFNDNNNIFSFDFLKREEENIIIPWLKKEKATEKIKKKYKDEKCSICLEEIDGNISITKCHHIFHYNCIAKNIKNYEKTECPICRCDLKTGKKKEIFNRNIFRLNNNENNEIFNNNNLEERNARTNQRNNNELNGNNYINIICKLVKSFLKFIGYLLLALLILLLLAEEANKTK